MANAGLRMLVAIDFSPHSERALRAARKLKHRVGGSLTLLHVRPSSDVRAAVVEERGDLVNSGDVRKGMSEHYRGRLDPIVRGRPDEAWKLRTGRPAVEIAREAARGYDLVVAGPRGAGAAVRIILGSTVQELLQRSRIPVLVVPAR
ncbi:MAG: universal stress protein [Thermoanaerobaculia bacterium]